MLRPSLRILRAIVNESFDFLRAYFLRNDSAFDWPIDVEALTNAR